MISALRVLYHNDAIMPIKNTKLAMVPVLIRLAALIESHILARLAAWREKVVIDAAACAAFLSSAILQELHRWYQSKFCSSTRVIAISLFD